MSLFQSTPDAVVLANNITFLSAKEITEDVFVKKCHSHNDYWRKIPCLEAIRHGVQSIEADIWAFDEDFSTELTETPSTSNDTVTTQQNFKAGELYVGHDLYYLNETWTLEKLYLDPIFELIESANPEFAADNKYNTGESPHGIFYGDVGATLYLFLDTKLDANTSYSYVKPMLQRFIDKDYLTYYNDSASKWVTRPLTIVMTGNLPVEMVQAEEPRFVTLDGKLPWFNSTSSDETMKDIAKYSVIASASYSQMFGGGNSFKTRMFNETEKAILAETYSLCHKYGVFSRIWDHVNWPRYIRDGQNKDIITLGADFLNIDEMDVADAF
ncbi:putative altered inheritance of mitochondria protein 6 homolog ARB_06966 [[Candida] jaroonii]|uniref:Altered inheritance of mitochondria protein 6 homolog ARB_06966 n=1 Tax=[Candida] jaroonii TaxID=467808 RepID=A0ACA9YGK9_9ASCO|nr:putative altered inheritance of mitochondria protein 6 homolog ARB_06966 [[Candida] jaroonii]